MEDRVSLYPGRVTLTPVSGQANTYDMVRADQPTQEGTPLSKANLLKDATAALLGLGSDAVPDDALAELGKYNEYWWKRIAPEVKGYVEKLGDELTSKSTAPYVWHGSSKYSVQYSTDILIDQSTGKVTLKNPQTFDMSSWSTNSASNVYQAAAALASLAPCYVSGLRLYGSLDTANDNIYYLPEGSTVSGDSDAATVVGWYGYDEMLSVFLGASTNTTSYPRARLVSSSYGVVTPAGSVEYVHSTNRNAYPDSGTQDGYTYTYLGVPFENAVTPVRIETGSYVGTGAVGATIPLSFTPKFVFVMHYFNGSRAIAFASTEAGAYVTSDSCYWEIADTEAPSVKVTTNGFIVGSRYSNWFNPSGYTGYYFAIG